MGQLLLVRHGQASWDSDDYDVLSPIGWEQSRLLGKALAARGIVPDAVVMGGMRRHRETAEACLGELGSALVPEVDPGWDEFDHVTMLGSHPAPFEGRKPTKAEFQEWFEAATDRWTGGDHDEEYAESFTAFTSRVGSALRRTAQTRGDRARLHQRRPDLMVGGRPARRRARGRPAGCGAGSTRCASTPASPAWSPVGAAPRWSPSTGTPTSTAYPTC